MTYPQPYGYPVVPVQTQVLVPPHRCSTGHVVVAWVLAVLTGLYLLPWAVAATRNRSNVAATALVNLFLGWTLVGWVVALVMACGSDRPVVLVQHGYAPVQGWAAPPTWSPAPPAPQPPRVIAPAPRPWPTGPTTPVAPTPPTVEHTRVDPFSTEPTVWLTDRPGPTDRR